MRLDHIAYRVADRKKAAQFFIDAFGYSVQTEFDINFEDSSTTQCIALQPPESVNNTLRTYMLPSPYGTLHTSPEIFVSDGSSDSIVGKWVQERQGIGGIHHLAYEVKDVTATMFEWIEKGWATFASEKPLQCPGLTQVFTTPHLLTGIIYEFIKREGDCGFCKDNVKNLMLSTQERQV